MNKFWGSVGKYVVKCVLSRVLEERLTDLDMYAKIKTRPASTTYAYCTNMSVVSGRTAQ